MGKQKEQQTNGIHTAFRQAFRLRQHPFPYFKAFRAGLAAALPVFIGLLFGHFNYGLLASLGGFAYLYVFNQPYAQRARRIFIVAVGLSLSVVLGTVFAPYPLFSAFVMGLIAMVSIFIFGALRISGPSVIFFVLTYAMTTGMPIDPTLAPLRGGLVFLGGILAWLNSMLGWLVEPHAPEVSMLQRVYRELAGFLEAIGTDRFNAARQRVVRTLKEAEEILIAGCSSCFSSAMSKRLLFLYEQANLIYLDAAAFSLREQSKLPAAWAKSVASLAERIGENDSSELTLPQPEPADAESQQLVEKIYQAYAILNQSSDQIGQEVQIFQPSLKSEFLAAFDKNSIVLLTAVRTGLVVIIAALVSTVFPFSRPYWVPLSCVAVMAGSTFIGTFHRAIQRAFGTLIGVLIASLILAQVHNGFVVALLIVVLTFLTEIFIVRNYGLAAMFFTPNALLMAEYSAQQFNFPYFATVRITDILAGSLLGLAGTILIGRRLASNLLNHFIAKTIRSQGQYLLRLFSARNQSVTLEISRERNKMRTNLTNLIAVYQTASGELTGKEQVEAFWPLLFSLEQLGYYLDASAKNDERPGLSAAELARLLYLFESMASSIEHQLPFEGQEVPEITGFPNLRHELVEMQKALKQRHLPLNS
ncbi:FUSC family protein [Brevibacillus fulvus]|uniref:Membrane protein YccC n=1 Tax=Brevibacillus fulvus TaxID=1125967 RepID=A0A938XYZ5_9BACL|nr:FUSC family protein [Brevibacillus fulvus]MBM7589011.1 putative membrane protein YccC [Brevibacillus fulvus]